MRPSRPPRLRWRTLAPTTLFSVLVSVLVVLLATVGPSALASGTVPPLPAVGPQVTTVDVDPVTDPIGAAATYAHLMTLLSVDTGVVPVSRAPRETGKPDCPPSRCEDVVVPVPHRVKVSSSTVRVLLPVGYRWARNRDTRYPVIFMWNGARSDHTGWTWKTDLIAMSRHWDAIFVMPDGGEGDDAGMNSDWFNGEYDWETFHTKVVVPWIDAHYRTIPTERGSVGASMGALGVFNYAAHNPGMFKAALSISGSVDTTTMALDTGGPQLDALLGLAPPDLRRVWGDPVRNRRYWNDHNPTLLAPRLGGLRIFMTSGTGYYGAGQDAVHSGTFEQQMWDMHKTFLPALDAAGIPYTLRVSIGGVHDWPWFNRPLQWGIPRVLDALQH